MEVAKAIKEKFCYVCPDIAKGMGFIKNISSSRRYFYLNLLELYWLEVLLGTILETEISW